MDLTDFLLARIAEDEAGVRDGMPERLVDWNPPGPWCYDSEYQDVRMNCGRALAECEAKRRIVELHTIRVDREWENPTDGPARQVDELSCELCGWVPDACDTVRTLAAIYADHPDYDPRWAV